MRALKWTFAGLLTLAGLTAALGFAPGDEKKKTESEKPDPALARTREEVQKLDILYKNAVVAVTELYDGPPAIKVAKKVFSVMHDNKFHDAKLVDASGAPQNEANLPQTPFEKRAEKAIQSGKPYYEEVVGEGDNRHLLAATIVPAVHKKCATCHGVKEGDLLGFIRYDVPIK